MKKVSVIVPCYNSELYIDRCMKSLTEQTIGISNIEIILVDDCSTDHTLDKLMVWEKKYGESVIVIPLNKHVMQGAARNIALSYASGEYICYLDSDDWLVSGALKKLYRISRQNNAEIVNYLSLPVSTFSNDTDSTKSNKPDYFVNITDDSELTRINNLFKGGLSRGCWSKFYLREFVLKNNLKYAEGVFDEESLFTMHAALVAKKVYFCNEYLHRYYTNPNGTCFALAKKDNISHRDDNALTWFQLYLKLKKLGIIEKYPIIFEHFFYTNYFILTLQLGLQRGYIFDIQAVKALQDTLKALFPDYSKNPYLANEPKYSRTFPLVEMQVTEDNIAEYNQLWRDYFKKYH